MQKDVFYEKDVFYTFCLLLPDFVTWLAANSEPLGEGGGLENRDYRGVSNKNRPLAETPG